MSDIRVSPEQLDQVANEFKRASGQSKDMVNQLNTQIESLHSTWAGMTQNKFYQEFQSWKTTMNNFGELLLQIGKELNDIATRFRVTDGQG